MGHLRHLGSHSPGGADLRAVHMCEMLLQEEKEEEEETRPATQPEEPEWLHHHSPCEYVSRGGR